VTVDTAEFAALRGEVARIAAQQDQDRREVCDALNRLAAAVAPGRPGRHAAPRRLRLITGGKP
jgi:hypothetical protein